MKFSSILKLNDRLASKSEHLNVYDFVKYSHVAGCSYPTIQECFHIAG